MTTSTPQQRKEALRIFIQMREAYADLLIRHDNNAFAQMYDETWDALLVLMEAVHGPCNVLQLSFPCSACLMEYAQHFLKVADEQCPKWFCASCAAALEAAVGGN